MNNYELAYEVVTKIIGPIGPVGETHTDEQRRKNLNHLILLSSSLIGCIDAVASRPETGMASIDQCIEDANDFLLRLQDTLKDGYDE